MLATVHEVRVSIDRGADVSKRRVSPAGEGVWCVVKPSPGGSVWQAGHKSNAYARAKS
jgi:hypothetical protein